MQDDALQAVENRHNRGLLDAKQYEAAKSEIYGEALALRFNSARNQVDAMDRIGTVSEEARVKAVMELKSINDEFYQQEVDHALALRKIHEENVAAKKDADREEEASENKRQEGISSAAGIISSLYTNVANSMADISAKAANIAGKGNVFFETAAANTRDATNELSVWVGKLEWANTMVDSFEKASQTAMGGWRLMYMDLEDKWKKVVSASKEKVKYELEMNKLSKIEISDTSDLYSIQNKLNSLRSTYKYLGEEDLDNLYEAKKALQEQINQQRLLNAEKNTANMDAINAKLEEARAAGVDIDNYEFDKKSANRLAALEKEASISEAEIAKQEFADAKAIAALEEQGATEEEIAAARLASEEKLAEMRKPAELRDLEMKALSTQLDVEQLNLKIINDLKIKQYEEELAREEELHQKRLENIEIENQARLAAIQPPDTSALDSTEVAATSGVQGYATGGRIPGESKIDSVPVLARPGEWFIRNESAQHWTQKFGAGFMNGINKPLSAAGRGISSALSKVGDIKIPEVAQVPKVQFATGGQVPKYKESDPSLSSKLDRLAAAIENQNRAAKSGEELPGKTITVNLRSEKTEVSGQYDEQSAQQLFKLLNEQRMVTG
jgi:hypothetical protein